MKRWTHGTGEPVASILSLKTGEEMKLELYTKNVYGVVRLYPACKVSLAIAAIKDAPTLTNKDVERLKEAGAEITIYTKEGEAVRV